MSEGHGKWSHVPNAGKSMKSAKEPMKLEPKLFLWLIGLVVLWIVVMAVMPMTPPTEAGEGEVLVLFKATANGNEILNKEIVFKEGINAFDAMQQVATVGYQDFGEMGVMVESINGVKPGENQFWKFFLNGEEATVGISSVTIQEDTTIEWVTEEMQVYTG